MLKVDAEGDAEVILEGLPGRRIIFHRACPKLEENQLCDMRGFSIFPATVAVMQRILHEIYKESQVQIMVVFS